MSVTIQRLRAPKSRTVETRRVNRGAWALVSGLLILAVAAMALLLARPEPTTEPASDVSVEATAERSSAVWSIKTQQAPLFAAQGPVRYSTATETEAGAAPSSASATSAIWEAKARYAQAASGSFGRR